MKTKIRQLENKLLKIGFPPRKDTAGLLRLGLRVPVLRNEVKKSGIFNELSYSDQLAAWNIVWNNSPYFEAMSMAIYYVQGLKSINLEEFQIIQQWVDRCTCWEHSDDLSKIHAGILEEHPDWILPALTQWNQSSCPWKRRQSVVSLLEYYSKRKKVLPFKKLISFIEPLLSDQEYYVQKGVGWTLREIYNAYPEETTKFLQNNLFSIDPVAYGAATEKIDKELKLHWNESRKARRKSSFKNKT